MRNYQNSACSPLACALAFLKFRSGCLSLLPICYLCLVPSIFLTAISPRGRPPHSLTPGTVSGAAGAKANSLRSGHPALTLSGTKQRKHMRATLRFAFAALALLSLSNCKSLRKHSPWEVYRSAIVMAPVPVLPPGSNEEPTSDGPARFLRYSRTDGPITAAVSRKGTYPVNPASRWHSAPPGLGGAGVPEDSSFRRSRAAALLP